MAKAKTRKRSTTAKVGKISTKASVVRKPKRKNTKEAKAARDYYHKKLKLDKKKYNALKKYRKDYYKKNKAKLDKKAKATYKARRLELLKKAAARRRAAGIKARKGYKIGSKPYKARKKKK